MHFRPMPAPPMTFLSIAIPIMIVTTAIAVVPVLIGSFRHDKAPEARFRSVAEESEFWHDLLGHHTVEMAPLPDLAGSRVRE